MSAKKLSNRKIWELEIFNQQDALFAIALVISLIGPLSVLVVALPYLMFWNSIRKSEKLSDEDDSYIRQIVQLPSRVLLRKSYFGTSAISIPFWRSLYVSDELIDRTREEEATAILAHEKGHLQNLDFFIFVVIGVSCIIYILRSSVNLPSAFIGCNIINPNSIYIVTDFGEYMRFIFSTEWFFSHRNFFVAAGAIIFATLTAIFNGTEVLKKYSPIMRSVIYLCVCLSVLFILYNARALFELYYLCDDERWNTYIGRSDDSIFTLVGTEIFWGIVTFIICISVVYTYGRILRRREFFADTIATDTLGAKYIQFLEAKARPPVWQNSVQKERGLAGKLRTLLYPSAQRRLEFQKSSDGASLSQVFIRTSVWAFAISMICTTYFLELATPEREDQFLLKMIPFVLGPFVIVGVCYFSNRWIINAMSEKRRSYALTIFGALWIGVLAAQFLFGVIDLSLYDRERTLSADLISRFWAILAYAITVFIMAFIFFNKTRYMWMSLVITIVGLFLASRSAVLVNERWDLFSNLPAAHGLMAAIIIVPVILISIFIRIGDFLFVRLR